jgi:AraC-like DNA-binding protein
MIETISRKGRGVRVEAHEFESGFKDSLHSHDSGQLLYAPSGVMSVIAEMTSLVLPPCRAIWLPAGTRHELYCRGRVSLRTIYIHPDLGALMPNCCVIEVTDFLKALILEVVEFGGDVNAGARERAIIDMLLREIPRMTQVPFRVPMPVNPRIVQVCTALLKDPSAREGIDDWAFATGMSRRTFTRAFRSETGMSVTAWRQQVRLMEALALLGMGRSVTNVAFDVGYESTSAFCAMFAKTFGTSPRRFLEKTDKDIYPPISVTSNAD